MGYAVAGGSIGLGYVVPVMVYQVHYELAFPFDNRAALVAAAVVLGLAGLGVRPPADQPVPRPVGARRLLHGLRRLAPAPASVAASAALLVPLAVVVAQPAPTVGGEAREQAASVDPPTTLRLMSWNVMYGRDHTGGAVDPGAIAAAVTDVGNTPTRLAQTDELLSAWGGRSHTVVGGDFNSWPSWPAARQWRTAGFVSAQDVAGDPDAFTAPSDAPDNRIDWIFGTPDLAFADFQLRDRVTQSDHLPLVVTVEPAEQTEQAE